MTFKISPSMDKLPPRYMSTPSRCGSTLGMDLVPAVVSNNGHLPSIKVVAPSAPVLTHGTVHVYENGIISGRMVLLHNETKSLEVTLASGKDGDESRLALAAVDGMSVVVHTSSGTFTLLYPDVDKTLVFYNERWNVFGWNSLTYSFYPEKSTQTLFPQGNTTIGFGYDVACSSDGCVVAVGSPETGNTGCVYVYTKKDSGFELAQVLTSGATGIRKEEGRTCVMNGLGTVIGFNSKNDNGDDIFILFEKNGSQWILSHIIEDECSDADMSSNGTTLVLSSPHCIRVYAYTSNGSTSEWAHVTDIEDQDDNVFGKRVALSGNGDVVVTVSEKHTAVIYNMRTPTRPTRHQLSDTGITCAVSVATDFSGNTIVVGSDDTHGRICVFTSPVTHGRYSVRPDPNFDKENIINNLFGVGHSVDVSADGNTMVVGAPKYNGTSGAVFTFTRTVGVWTLRSKIIGATGTVLGYSAAVSSDASQAVIGAIGNTGSVQIIT